MFFFFFNLSDLYKKINYTEFNNGYSFPSLKETDVINILHLILTLSCTFHFIVIHCGGEVGEKGSIIAALREGAQHADATAASC